MKARRSWKIGAIVAAGVVAGITLLGMICLWWIIPKIFAGKLKDAIRWNGDLTVGGVSLHYSEPVELRDIRLRDKGGRDWLLIETLSLTFRDWPGTAPAVTEVAIRNVQLRMHFVNGRLDLPLRGPLPPSTPDSDEKSADLSTLTARNLSLTLTDGSSQCRWDGFQLKVNRHGQTYRLSLNSLPTLSASGSWNPNTSDAQFTLKAHLAACTRKTAALLRIFAVPFARAAEGMLDIDTTLKGRLNAPETLCLSGRAALEGWTIQAPYGDLVHGLSTTVAFNGRSLELGPLTADGCGGILSGTAHLEMTDEGMLRYGSALAIKGVDLPTLTKTISGPSPNATTGTLGLQLELKGLGNACGGHGAINLRRSDVMSVPGLSQIFTKMALPGEVSLRRSDGAGTFTFQGLTLTVKKVRLTNAVSALEGDPGGTVNLRTHRLDLYVLAVPLKAVESAVGGFLRLPGVRVVGEPLMKFRDQLIRLHVQGDWSDQTSTLVHNEALQDVGEGTMDFLESVLTNGGELGEDSFDGMVNVFK